MYKGFATATSQM